MTVHLSIDYIEVTLVALPRLSRGYFVEVILWVSRPGWGRTAQSIYALKLRATIIGYVPPLVVYGSLKPLNKNYIHSWEACQNSLRLRFKYRPQEVRSRFNGKTSPREHLEQCFEAWKNVPHEEWVHRFVHTLEPVAKN